MPVRRRRDSTPDAWWLDFYVGGKRYQLTRRAPNKRAAQALEREERRRIEAGQAQQRGKATVAAAFERYWEEHGRFLASAGSERGYLNRWADVLGDGTTLAAVDAATVARSVASWRSAGGSQLDRHRQPRDRKHVTDSTINHRILCLQRIWNRAEEVWGWTLPRIPWRRLKLPERKELPDRSIDRSTLRLLLRALSPRSRSIVIFARVTGLRRGALLRLSAGDVDWQSGIIRAISKGRAGGKLTPVPITRRVRWVLRRSGFYAGTIALPTPAGAAHAGGHVSMGATIPLQARIGRLFPVSKQLLRQDWEEARALIGRPDLQFKDLRHSFAQALEDAGAGDMISDALHHSDPRLRRRYAKARIDAMRERLDALGRSSPASRKIAR